MKTLILTTIVSLFCLNVFAANLSGDKMVRQSLSGSTYTLDRIASSITSPQGVPLEHVIYPASIPSTRSFYGMIFQNPKKVQFNKKANQMIVNDVLQANVRYESRKGKVEISSYQYKDHGLARALLVGEIVIIKEGFVVIESDSWDGYNIIRQSYFTKN